MRARRAVGSALRADDAAALSAARGEVDAAKVRLGERGPPWWTDGAPDYNRRMARNTPYAEWFAALAMASLLAPDRASTHLKQRERANITVGSDEV